MIYLVIYLWVIGGLIVIKSKINPLQQGELVLLIGWPFVFGVGFVCNAIKRGN